MNGREHFHQAEQLLEEASDPADHGVSWLHAHIALAQVHATLAAAAAMSKLVGVWADVAELLRADAELADDLADDKPAPFTLAEPLVLCNAPPADDGPERCTLPIDHPENFHEDQRHYGVKWMTYPTARPYVSQVAGGEPIFQSVVTDAERGAYDMAPGV